VIRYFLLLIAIFALGAAAIVLLKPDAGYVLINYGHWVAETSLAVLVVGLALWYWLFYLLFKLLMLAIRLPANWRERLDQRRNDRARSSFEDGLQSLFEGNWKRAEMELVRRASDHHAAHLNYIAAARAAQHQGAADRRDHYLQLAAQNKPELAFTTQLAQADLQRKRGEFEATRSSALALRALNPEHPFAVELLAESYLALGDWEPLRQLLAGHAGLAALVPQRREELLRRATVELMRTAIADARLDRLKGLWDAAGSLRDQAEVRREYVRGLARLNADAEALALIAQTLTREWDAELAQLYGDLHTIDPIAQLATVEQWLGQYGEKPELLQVAGRVCLRNKLWGKARSYLEAVLQSSPTPKAFLDLARLCAETQHPEDAAKFFRQGLELATQSS
jgi:HemY protein